MGLRYVILVSLFRRAKQSKSGRKIVLRGEAKLIRVFVNFFLYYNEVKNISNSLTASVIRGLFLSVIKPK